MSFRFASARLDKLPHYEEIYAELVIKRICECQYRWGTVLHWAAAHTGKRTDSECHRQAAIAQLLIAQGADLSHGGEYRNTPIKVVAAIEDE